MTRPEITLEDLITDFLSKVDIGTKLLEEKFGTRNILRLWGSKQIERCGEIKNGVQYELHGIGCFIIFATESVNFDYGSGDRVDGFDIWRLYSYATDRPLRYKKYCDKQTLEKEFREYLSSKKIEKMSPVDDLYVLTNPNQT